jgi:glycosyltransferase 2 family protein
MIPPAAKSAARWILAALIIAFLVYGLAANWDKLQKQNVRIDALQFVFATLFNVIFLASQAFVWRECVRFLGYPLPIPTAGSIWITSQVSKYVPGKVMLLIVRVLYGERAGVPKSATILSIYLELVLMVVTGTSVFLLFCPDLLSKFEGAHLHPAIPPILVAAGIAGLHPKLLNLVVNFGLRLLKREPVKIDIPYWKLLSLGVILMAGWLFHGLAALSSVRAVGITVKAGLLTHTGFFAVSWVLGFLSFLTPGGIGVREGVLAFALGTIYSMEIGIAVALISRLAWVLAEIVLAGALWPWHPKPAEQK